MLHFSSKFVHKSSSFHCSASQYLSNNALLILIALEIFNMRILKGNNHWIAELHNTFPMMHCKLRGLQILEGNTFKNIVGGKFNLVKNSLFDCSFSLLIAVQSFARYPCKGKETIEIMRRQNLWNRFTNILLLPFMIYYFKTQQQYRFSSYWLL